MARVVFGGSLVSLGAILSLCARDRHGPPGAESKLELYLDPPLHLHVGVTLAVSLTEMITLALIRATGKEMVVSTHNGTELKNFINDAKADSPLIVASNHNTYLDAPLLAPMIGKCTSSMSFLWIRDTKAWIFSAASASLLFAKNPMATVTSLLCGLPIQQRWKERNQPHPDDLLSLNAKQHIKDLVSCVNRGRILLFFPEGRLIQDQVEPRDEKGRWTQLDGSKNEPGELVASCYSGIGRVVAHTKAKVIPAAHVGLDDILTSKETYELKNVKFNMSPEKGVVVHFGQPLDFSQMIDDFEKAHPHLTPFSSQERGIGSSDYMCEEKRKLYREITKIIRNEILRCHDTAREQRK